MICCSDALRLVSMVSPVSRPRRSAAFFFSSSLRYPASSMTAASLRVSTSTSVMIRL